MGPLGTRLRWWVDGNASQRLRALLESPDSVLQGPGSVAREQGGRKRFFRLENDPGEPALFVKVFALPPGVARLRYFLRPSKARRESAVARRVEARGFEAARPVALGEERRSGLLLRSFSVIPELPARDLGAVLADPDLARDERRALVEDFAGFARRLHDAGIDQDDFSPNNFLVYTDRRFALLDFERCRVGRRLGARRYTLLAKLHRKGPGVSRSDRLRFLRHYLAPDGDRAGRRAAWLRIRGEFRRIRSRDARRAAESAFKLGRNLVREGEAWVVRGRERDPGRGGDRLRLELGSRDARRAWVSAHQLERLGLPALRPARLLADAVELEAPPGAKPADPSAVSVRTDERIARARRRYDACGRFASEPEWLLTETGALLRDPRAFRIEL